MRSNHDSHHDYEAGLIARSGHSRMPNVLSIRVSEAKYADYADYACQDGLQKSQALTKLGLYGFHSMHVLQAEAGTLGGIQNPAPAVGYNRNEGPARH